MSQDLNQERMNASCKEAQQPSGTKKEAASGRSAPFFTLQNPAADAQAGRKTGEAGGKMVGRLSKPGELRLTPRTLQLAKQKNLQGAFRSEKNWHTKYS